MLVAIKKCKFRTTKTEFYKFIMELGKLSIDLKKIKAIVNQQKLSNVIELQSFLNFVITIKSLLNIS